MKLNYIISGCIGMIKKPQRAQRARSEEEERESLNNSDTSRKDITPYSLLL